MMFLGVILEVIIFHWVFLSWARASVLFKFKINVKTNKEDLGKCYTNTLSKTAVVKGTDGNERVLICVKSNGKYIWKALDGSPTLGEFFNPAEDCSDIVRKNRDPKSGFYWIKGSGLKRSTKVWCDLTTDGGGFMLVGYKDSPVSWTLPSNPNLVSPQGKPHWSSEFGNASVLDFRIQVSKTNNFSDTKADWLYRFTTPRRLTKLLMSNEGGCTSHYPGIGHIAYVKDLFASKIVTRNFQCSRFGPSYPSELGWKLMNKCLGKPCKEGFAIFPRSTFRYDNFGAFSYSSNSPRSGVSHNSTVFIGCEHGKCCACFGPKGAAGDFCAPGCRGINGGTVTNKAQAWFWIRSSVPKIPAWRKCMEYEVQTEKGDTEIHFIDETTGVSKKGSCTQKGKANLVDGVVEVADKEALNSIPMVKGLLSYRKDKAKLYVSNGQNWEPLGKEKHVKDLANRLSLDERETLRVSAELKKVAAELEKKVQALEKRLNESIKGSKDNPAKSCEEILSNDRNSISGVYWIKTLGRLSYKPFQVYCNMETHGGGWTLVYSYTFTNYNSFSSSSNAVTPRPNWPASSANVPISTSPPLGESLLGAIDFNLWKEIGKEILIKSNINDWIVCQPRTGSLVLQKAGSLNCQNIKNVATRCYGVAPDKITWHTYGPYLSASSLFYYFDGNTHGNWPTHDPCGKNSVNEKRGVPNPGGSIFIR